MLESLRNLARLRTKNQWYQWRLQGIKDLFQAVDMREKKALQARLSHCRSLRSNVHVGSWPDSSCHG
jgi:hypothetical protein